MAPANASQRENFSISESINPCIIHAAEIQLGMHTHLKPKDKNMDSEHCATGRHLVEIYAPKLTTHSKLSKSRWRISRATDGPCTGDGTIQASTFDTLHRLIGLTSIKTQRIIDALHIQLIRSGSVRFNQTNLMVSTLRERYQCVIPHCIMLQ
jgi:hypothetical protein